jgi:hypothetical protein
MVKVVKKVKKVKMGREEEKGGKDEEERWKR